MYKRLMRVVASDAGKARIAVAQQRLFSRR